MVVRLGGRALEQQDFAARGLSGRTKALWGVVPARHLAMRGVTEVEALLAMLVSKMRGVGARGYGHGLDGLIILELTALAHQHGGDVFLHGDGSSKEKRTLARLTVPRKVKFDRGASRSLNLVSPGNVYLTIQSAALDAYLRAHGFERQAIRRILHTHCARPPAQRASSGSGNLNLALKMLREQAHANVLRARGAWEKESESEPQSGENLCASQGTALNLENASKTGCATAAASVPRPFSR